MTRAVATALAIVAVTASTASAAIPVRSTAFIPHHDVPTVKRHVVVKRGDTLGHLFADTPGGPYRAAYVNDIPNPDLITVGAVLTVPLKDGKRRLPSATPVAVSRSGWRSTEAETGTGRCGGDLPTCEIMECESGGDIRAQNPTSSASGKWAVIDSTWNGYGGYAHAKDAPESVQDDFARQLWDNGNGRSHWVC